MAANCTHPFTYPSRLLASQMPVHFVSNPAKAQSGARAGRLDEGIVDLSMTIRAQGLHPLQAKHADHNDDGGQPDPLGIRSGEQEAGDHKRRHSLDIRGQRGVRSQLYR